MFIVRALVQKKYIALWKWFALTSFLLVGAFLRFYQLEYKSLWVDEIIQVVLASGSFFDTIANMRTQPAAPPLDYLITWLTLQSGKNGIATSEFVLRFPDVVWGILAIPVGYALAKRTTRSVAVALLTAYLIALAPLLVRFSQEVRFYSLSVLTMLVVADLFVRAYQEPILKNWILFGIAMLAAFLTHYYSLLVLAALVLSAASAFALRLWRTRSSFGPSFARRRLLIGGALLAALVVAAGAWLVYAAPQQMTVQMFKLTSIPEVIGEPITSGHVSGDWHLLAVRILGLAAFPALAVLGVVVSVYRFRASRTGQLWIPAVALIVLCGYIGVLGLDWLFRYFFTSRQLLFVAPFYFILIATGTVGAAQLLWQKNRILGGLAFVAVVASVTLLFGLSLRAYYDWPKDDWRSAAQFLQRATAVQPALIVTDPATLRDYLNYYQPALWSIPELPKKELTVENLTAFDRVWIIEQDGRRPPVFEILRGAGWNMIETSASPALNLHYAGPVSAKRLWEEVTRTEVPAQVLVYSDILEENGVCDTDNIPLVVNARAALSPPTDPPLLDAQRGMLRRKLRRLC